MFFRYRYEFTPGYGLRHAVINDTCLTAAISDRTYDRDQKTVMFRLAWKVGSWVSIAHADKLPAREARLPRCTHSIVTQ